MRNASLLGVVGLALEYRIRKSNLKTIALYVYIFLLCRLLMFGPMKLNLFSVTEVAAGMSIKKKLNRVSYWMLDPLYPNH